MFTVTCNIGAADYLLFSLLRARIVFPSSSCQCHHRGDDKAEENHRRTRHTTAARKRETYPSVVVNTHTLIYDLANVQWL